MQITFTCNLEILYSSVSSMHMNINVIIINFVCYHCSTVVSVHVAARECV